MNEQDVRIETRSSCEPIETDRGCSENVAENLTVYFFRKGREEQDKVWKKHIRDKIKELKERKKNLIHQNSTWAMDMTINEMETLI